MFNEKDIEMFNLLLKDKGKKYRVIIDNDLISFYNKETEEEIHTFKNFGEYFIEEVLKQLGLDAEVC